MVLIFCDKEIYTHKGFFASHGHGFSREEPAFPCIIREASPHICGYEHGSQTHMMKGTAGDW